MAFKTPSTDRLRTIAEQYGLRLNDQELDLFQDLCRDVLASCESLETFPEAVPPQAPSRSTGAPPDPGDNPYNAWAWRYSLEDPDAEGVLEGKTVALKDMIPVAGIPMSDGTPLLDGYIPERDATVVRWIVDQGAEITGQAVCEHLSYSGVSFTSKHGPVQNPHRPTHSAGGSSSGPAALVAGGECDVAMGGDQGGSIRIPCSHTGVFGLKATSGLIPYTGCAGIDPSLDHIGPIASTVEDLTRLLQAVSGYDDGRDPRQRRVEFESDHYLDHYRDGIEGMTVGLLEEGFGWEGMSDEDVDETVRESARVFEEAGADLREVSIPEHRQAWDMHVPLLLEGSLRFMIDGYGAVGPHGTGYFNTGLSQSFARGLNQQPDQLFETVKAVILIGRYLQEEFGSRFYCRAQNVARNIRARYKEAFRDLDLLVTPTTPQQAPPLPDDPAQNPLEAVQVALDPANIVNTCPFNSTSYPALNVPCGKRDGLPVGMQLVADHWREIDLLRAAHVFEERA